jgi:DNA-binding response OmpR family regulator
VKAHLLVVEDEEPVCKTLRRYLAAHEYQVTSASSAEEALEQLDYLQIDLVVTDILLPGMDGLAFLKSVKENHPNLPVIIVTGMGFDEVAMSEALENRADGFVSKGLTLSQLLMEVHRVLSRTLASESEPA